MREDVHGMEPMPSDLGPTPTVGVAVSDTPQPAPELEMPGPYRKRLDRALRLNAGCVSCHADEAKAWQGSHHQRSHLNPAYKKAFSIEPLAFCRGCHAPEADPHTEPSPALGALGVGCVSCHLGEDGVVLAALAPEKDSMPSAPKAPHALQRSAEFSKSGACSGCHEFRFPGASGAEDGIFMQTTAREHERSSGASKSCAHCHMPLVEGKRSHRFAEVRDPAWLRENLKATVERTEDNTLWVRLVQPSPGHAFPTGDLFRRLEVGLELYDGRGKVLRRDIRYLARHFEMIPGKAGRRLSEDNRVFDEPKEIELDFAPPSSGPRPAKIQWWVRYQRVATVGEGVHPSQAIVESEIELYSGVFLW